MYNTNRNLLFFAKRSKPNADGQIPVFSRISVDGKQLEFSMNISLLSNSEITINLPASLHL